MDMIPPTPAVSDIPAERTAALDNSTATADNSAPQPHDQNSHLQEGNSSKPTVLDHDELISIQEPPKSQHKLPAKIENLLRLTFDLDDQEWSAMQFYIYAAIEDLRPSIESEYLDVVNYADLLHQRMKLMGHQGRLQRLQISVAIREVIRPGCAKLILNGDHLRPRDLNKSYPIEDVASIGGKRIFFLEHGSDEDEALLKARAIEILKQQGSGPKALETLAFRLALPELNDVAKQLALVDARLDSLRDAASRRRSMRTSIK